MTVKRAPRPFSPGAICSFPAICFISEPMIFIPRPRLSAGRIPPAILARHPIPIASDRWSALSPIER